MEFTRERPKEIHGHTVHVPDLEWQAFNDYCDENAIGINEEDWAGWYDCWVAALRYVGGNFLVVPRRLGGGT